MGFGNTAHRRGKTAQAVRQHIVIRGNLNTAKTNAVEHFGRSAAVANGQLAFQRNNGPLKIGIDVVPLAVLTALPAAIAPGRIITQAPWPKVKTAVKA
ncbi:hypothetical protein D3C75_792680 [compost metagenome]